MDADTLIDIEDLFDEIDDATNNFIDQIEIEPQQISDDIFITGFKRLTSSYSIFEIHLKQIKKVKIDKDEYELSEPYGDIWIKCNMIADATLKNIVKIFKQYLQNNDDIFLTHVTYKLKNLSNLTFNKDIVFTNRRIACKEILQMKKNYQDVKFVINDYKFNKFLGKIQKELTDFEIATQATTCTT